MPTLTLDLAGTPLTLDAQADALSVRVQRTLAPLGADPVPGPQFHASLRCGEPAAMPLDALVHYEGEPPLAGGTCVFGERGDERFLVFPGRVSLVGSVSRRAASIVVQPKDAPGPLEFCVMHLLEWALEADQQTLLHAAAFASREGGSGFLVFAPSGSGKTTLALALLKGGFPLFSDDIAILSNRGGVPMLGGLARSLKVHRNTARLMPWAEPLLGPTWNAEDEQPLTLASAAGIGKLVRRPVPLVAIIRLAGHGPGAHKIKPISGMETLISLSDENVRTGRAGLPGHERLIFQRLGDIVSRVATFELSTGSDLGTLPALIASTLEQVEIVR